MPLKLEDVFEYSIGAEVRVITERAGLQQEFKSFNIILKDSPETGWGKVFKVLSESGEMKDVFRIQYCNAQRKQILLGE